jgi:hypothetical protein
VTAFLMFAAFVVGFACAILIGLAIINRPLPEREHPVVSMVGGNSRARTTGPEDLFNGADRRLL